MIRSEEIRFKLRRGGAEFAEIFPAEGSAPSLKADSKSTIKMSLQGTFLPYALDSNGRKIDVEWLTDEIKPVLVVNGIETPLGVLMPSTIKQNSSDKNYTVDLEAYDRTWRVRDTRRAIPVYFEAGTPYLDAVEALLVESGITMIARTETNSVLTEDREDWDIGTSNLDIVNALLEEINYNEVWFDSVGAAVLQPKSMPVAENIQHVFTDKRPDPRNPKEIGIIGIHPETTKTLDVYSVPNVFICICSNADKSGGMVAVAENTNPMSPLSIPRRGRRIVGVERVDNIAFQIALQSYADQRVTESIMTGEKIDVKTQLQPGFGVGDIVFIQTEDVMGICVEKSWSMELKPGGVMSHDLERVVYTGG